MDRVTARKQPRRLRTALFVPPRVEPLLLAVTAVALVAGGVCRLAGSPGLADVCWGLGTVAAVLPAVGWVLADLRRGHGGVDVIAVLALGGTLAVGEYLAGALIALMLATGRTLEATAQRRASRDLRALLERAPRTARLLTPAGVRAVPSAEVAVGDLLVVGPGEVVPVIDVAVILNALRVLRDDGHGRPVLPPSTEALIHRFAAEHPDLRDVLDAVRDAADHLSDGPGPGSLAPVAEVHRLLTERLLPHEYAEEHQLYPALAPTLGGPEATATMSRAHAEIERLARRVATHLALAGPDGTLSPEQLDDLRACLYGLNTVLRLHFTQEEESYFSLAR
jgi:hypothetical protein